MPPTIVTPPSEEPIAVADARVQCRSSAAEDGLLQSVYIPAARALAETMIRRPIISRQARQAHATLDTTGLPFALQPVIAVQEVEYLDEAGDVQTLPSNQYQLVQQDGGDWLLLPADDVTWPRAAQDIAGGAVTVLYTAGLAANAAAVPADLRAWLLLTVNHLWENRGAMDTHGRMAAQPGRFYDSLLDKHRAYGF